MLARYYINKEWISSSPARRIYRAAATLSIVLVFTVVLLFIVGDVPASYVPLVKLVVFAGVLGTATTMVAMEYFLFGFDTSSVWKKALWFCVMLLPPIGPAVYCFVVYSRAVPRPTNESQRAAGASAGNLR